jgi:glycosyltransferase involved in cell wall biosynthesis
MKVLHILNELRYSGAEMMLISAAPWFVNEEMAATVLSTGDKIGPVADELRKSGYVVEHIPFEKKLRFFVRVRSLIRNGKFDLAHIHCERAYPFYAAAAWPMTPAIRTVHHLFQFRGALRIRKILERAVCRIVFGVTEINNSISGQSNERKRFYSRGGILAENWYDDTRYRRPSLEERNSARNYLKLNKNDFVFISLGSNVDYKNYDLIVRALQLIPPQFPIKYLHVGDEGQGKPLSTLARDLGVETRTIFPGSVKDAVRYLWASDCFVMPSREEGFGIAAVEAMSTGLPVILSRRPALTDFARYMDGILYVAPCVDELTQQMTFAHFRSATDRYATGAQLSAAVSLHFGAKRGALRYLSIYDAVTRRPPKEVISTVRHADR